MFSRNMLENHSLDMRQFIDLRESTLPSGMRIVEGYNSSGLSFTLLPDRGMDIWTASYNGLPLTWVSPGSPFPPDFGAHWLRQYNGGLMTTCGLQNVGDSEIDSITGESRGLHGDFTRLRAYQLEFSRGWADEKYRAELTCFVTQSSLFGEQLQVRRTYSITLGEPLIDIRDEVQNQYDVDSPLMLLYHFNLGYPLICDGATLVVPGEAIYAYDEEARKGLVRWAKYDFPVPHANEQVFYHHLKTSTDGKTRVALVNRDFGIQVEWDTKYAPYFTQWKNIRRGIYVSGIEPGNCLPEGLNAARKHGRLVMLQPGETHTFQAQLRILQNPAEIDEATTQIGFLKTSGQLLSNCNFSGL